VATIIVKAQSNRTRAARIASGRHCVIYNCIIVVKNSAGSGLVVLFYSERGGHKLFIPIFSITMADETEKLIDLVHYCPYLYDTSQTEYKNIVKKNGEME